MQSSHQLASGLNLTVADTIVFINTPPGPAIAAQALGRCVRIGQVSPTVRVVHLLTDGEEAEAGGAQEEF